MRGTLHARYLPYPTLSLSYSYLTTNDQATRADDGGLDSVDWRYEARGTRHLLWHNLEVVTREAR
jgi:hypothetical protein